MFGLFKRKENKQKRLIDDEEQLKYLINTIHIYNEKNSTNLIHPFIILEINDDSWEKTLLIKAASYDVAEIKYGYYSIYSATTVYLTDIGEDILQLFEEKILEAEKIIDKENEKRKQQAREEILKHFNG